MSWLMQYTVTVENQVKEKKKNKANTNENDCLLKSMQVKFKLNIKLMCNSYFGGSYKPLQREQL